MTLPPLVRCACPCGCARFAWFVREARCAQCIPRLIAGRGSRSRRDCPVANRAIARAAFEIVPEPVRRQDVSLQEPGSGTPSSGSRASTRPARAATGALSPGPRTRTFPSRGVREAAP